MAIVKGADKRFLSQMSLFGVSQGFFKERLVTVSAGIGYLFCLDLLMTL